MVKARVRPKQEEEPVTIATIVIMAIILELFMKNPNNYHSYISLDDPMELVHFMEWVPSYYFYSLVSFRILQK